MDDSFQSLDFSNTEIAFSAQNNDELKKTDWLFRMMNKQWLVKLGSSVALFLFKIRFPLLSPIVKNTIFKHFCGGVTLLDCQKTIDKLYEFNTLSILDYGAEGKETEKDFNKTMNMTNRAIDFAASNSSVPVVSLKITGIARFALLEKLNERKQLTNGESSEYENVLKRLDAICFRANEMGIAVFIDAEESWIQNAIDDLTNKMMDRYNKKKVVVYNTFQLYRKDRLAYLKESHLDATEKGYMLGAKLVRGAYMEKEAARAADMGYENPIQASKEDTDRDFNEAVYYCVKNYETIASCCASHNAESNMYQARLIADFGIAADHPHLNFSQLYGMSDHITFNLAAAGYNVAKYIPFGPVRDVMPYLIRRAQENTSVTGDMSREYGLIHSEMVRRGLADA